MIPGLLREAILGRLTEVVPIVTLGHRRFARIRSCEHV